MLKETIEKFIEAVWGEAIKGYLSIYCLPSKIGKFINLSEPDALNKAYDFIISLPKSGNIYHCMGLFQSKPQKGRGKEVSVLGIPGFWMDIDIRGDTHKKSRLPESVQQVTKFLNELPFKPSLIVNSGYGLHIYWLFLDIWYFSDESTRLYARKLSDRFQEYIISKARGKGWELDKTSDLVRLLRIPGAYNLKKESDPKPVKIISSDPKRYNYEEFFGLIPNEKTKPKKPPKGISGVEEGRRNEEVFQYALSRLAKGYNKEEVLSLVKEKAALCLPPLPEKEAIACYKSALKYIDETKFFEGRRFIPKALVEYVLRSNELFHDGSSLYRYDPKGVWLSIHDNEIRQVMTKTLGKKATNSRINDAFNILTYSVYKKSEELVQNRNLINFANGMLDITTGKLLPHDKNYFSLVQVPIKYDPEAKCPRFDRFLQEIFSDDPIKILAVQDFTGYCLYPKIIIHQCLFCIGTGSNGKNTFIDTILKIMGEENVCTLNLHQLTDKFLLGTLKDKLLNISSEVQMGSPIKENILKGVISGNLIKADIKFKDPIEFRPIAKHIFAMNELPIILDKTYAFQRRVIVVKFNQVFKGEKEDLFLEDKLSKELSGILNWCLEGLNRVLKNKCITVSDQMERDKGEFIKQVNPILLFVEEECILGEKYMIRKERLYFDYVEWSKWSGLKPLSKVKFYRQLLEDFPLIKEDTFGQRKFKGIDLKTKSENQGVLF